MFTRIAQSTKKVALVSTALALLAAPAISSAEEALHPQQWAVELHASIPAQGNEALQMMQKDFVQKAGDLEAGFLPPQILGMQQLRRDDAPAS